MENGKRKDIISKHLEMNDKHFQIGWKPWRNIISVIIYIKKGEKLGGFSLSPTEIICKTEDRWQTDKDVTSYLLGECSLGSLEENGSYNSFLYLSFKKV